MTLFPSSVLLFAVIAAVPGQESPSTLDWDKAEKEIQRLPPNAFPQLPVAVISELNRRRCNVPQAYGHPDPHNVIKGSFVGKGQIDWAVLCSQGGESSILVFRDGSGEIVSQLEKRPDKIYLQALGEGRIGYSRMIGSVEGEVAVRYQEAFGGPKPPPFDHQVIEDSFLEKASIILYYYRGTWLRLTGAD
jgi:hypothetical protein